VADPQQPACGDQGGLCNADGLLLVVQEQDRHAIHQRVFVPMWADKERCFLLQTHSVARAHQMINDGIHGVRTLCILPEH